MKCVNIWKFEYAVWANIFQTIPLINCYKVIYGGKASHSIRWLMDFNVTAYEMFINTLSDFTLELSFNKQPLVKVWYDIKKEYPELSGKMIKEVLPFLAHVCMRQEFLRYFNQNKIVWESRSRYEPPAILLSQTLKRSTNL